MINGVEILSYFVRDLDFKKRSDECKPRKKEGCVFYAHLV